LNIEKYAFWRKHQRDPYESQHCHREIKDISLILKI
jgi:hypothetical protein